MQSAFQVCLSCIFRKISGKVGILKLKEKALFHSFRDHCSDSAAKSPSFTVTCMILTHVSLVTFYGT